MFFARAQFTNRVLKFHLLQCFLLGSFCLNLRYPSSGDKL